MLFDTHTHLNNDSFTEEERAALAAEIEASDVGLVMDVGFDEPSALLAVEHANRYPWCYAVIGMHPHDSKLMDEAMLERFRQIAKSEPKVNERQPHAQQNTFAFFDEAVNSNQCKHQKRQIIDEHQLKMRVKKAACRHIKHAAGKRRPSSCRVLLVVSPQPYVDHITAEQKLKYRITAEDVFHPNTRKQVSQQNIRPQQPIIGEVIDRYTPAQIYI